MSQGDEYTKKKASFESLPTYKKEMKDRYDQAFLGILQNETRIEPFVDAVFSFLYRKTDFYRTLTEESKVGFPSGVAENMLRCYFMKYNMLTKDAEDAQQSTPSIPIETSIPERHRNMTETPKQPKVEKPIPPPAPRPTTQTDWQNESDSHNGAVRDNYSWNQNFEDIDITIPTKVSNSKLIKIVSQRKSLKVVVENEVIMDDQMQHEVKADDTTWSLEKGKQITINLTKSSEVWWSKLLTNEEAIDMKKIHPERGMESMPADERAVINRLQFDEMQKQLGNPQSHEVKVHNMLKKGWDAEGSPFKGQDFDPSMFDINSSAVQM